MAGHWRQHDRARFVLEEGKTSSNVFQTGYLGQLARLEPEQAMAQLQKQPTRGNSSQRDAELAAIAVQLAIDHPAQAERFFNLREGRTDRFPSKAPSATATLPSSGPKSIQPARSPRRCLARR